MASFGIASKIRNIWKFGNIRAFIGKRTFEWRHQIQRDGIVLQTKQIRTFPLPASSLSGCDLIYWVKTNNYLKLLSIRHLQYSWTFFQSTWSRLCFLPFFALTTCSPIDSVASITMFFSYLTEALDPADYRVWLFLCCLPPNAEREKKPSEFCTLSFAFSDGGKRTWATSATSEYAIHYSIASRKAGFVTNLETAQVTGIWIFALQLRT